MVKTEKWAYCLHSLSPLGAPGFQLYLPVHTEVKTNVLRAKAPHQPSLQAPSHDNIDYWINFVMWSWVTLSLCLHAVKNYQNDIARMHRLGLKSKEKGKVEGIGTLLIDLLLYYLLSVNILSLHFLIARSPNFNFTTKCR